MMGCKSLEHPRAIHLNPAPKWMHEFSPLKYEGVSNGCHYWSSDRITDEDFWMCATKDKKSPATEFLIHPSHIANLVLK